jgi:hypothetical protein
MAGEKAKMKLLTLQEANALLPQVRLSLRSLRELKAVILRGQAQIEIEEMTGSDGQGKLDFSAQAAINHQMDVLQAKTVEFEKEFEKLFAIGVQLKDLDTGLVDFYSRRGSEIVFLCWKEGEVEITHWHSLEGGFQSRKSL